MNIIYLATEDVTSARVSGKVHFWAVASELSRLGHRVIVVAPRFTRTDSPSLSAPMVNHENLHVITYFAPGKNPFGILCFELTLAAKIRGLRRRYSPSAALVRGGGPGWFMGILFLWFRCLGIPVILECNGIVWRELRYRNQSWMFVANAYISAWQQAATCNVIVGVSKGITEAYRRLGRRAPNRCRTIPNGTNVDDFSFLPEDRLAARAAMRIARDAFVAGYVGVFSAWHDIRGMVTAAKILHDRHGENIVFALVGNGHLYPWACEEKSRHQIDNLLLPGEACDRAALLRWLSCFDVGLCLYTDLEGSPLKMFEYMAAGIPIVGAGFPQIMEICERDGVGIGLRTLSPESIAEAIQAMSQNRQQWEQVGAANRVLAHKQYTWERVAADVDATIRFAQSGG